MYIFIYIHIVEILSTFPKRSSVLDHFRFPPLSRNPQCLVNGFLLNVSPYIALFLNMRKLCQTNTTKDDYVAGLA